MKNDRSFTEELSSRQMLEIDACTPTGRKRFSSRFRSCRACLTTPSWSSASKMTKFDLNGRCLVKKSVEVETGYNKYVVNMSKYAIRAGVYIVSLKTDNKLYTGKIVVQ